MSEEQFVSEELSKAREALQDAKLLLDRGGSDEGVVNRLYYAAFHAAQAALYSQDIDPTSHGGVRNQFGSELVLNGHASREQGRLLTTLADLRQQADYGYNPLDVECASLRDRTAEFVDAMASFVETESTDDST